MNFRIVFVFCFLFLFSILFPVPFIDVFQFLLIVIVLWLDVLFCIVCYLSICCDLANGWKVFRWATTLSSQLEDRLRD